MQNSSGESRNAGNKRRFISDLQRRKLCLLTFEMDFANSSCQKALGAARLKAGPERCSVTLGDPERFPSRNSSFEILSTGSPSFFQQFIARLKGRHWHRVRSFPYGAKKEDSAVSALSNAMRALRLPDKQTVDFLKSERCVTGT